MRENGLCVVLLLARPTGQQHTALRRLLDRLQLLAGDGCVLQAREKDIRNRNGNFSLKKKNDESLRLEKEVDSTWRYPLHLFHTLGSGTNNSTSVEHNGPKVARRPPNDARRITITQKFGAGQMSAANQKSKQPSSPKWHIHFQQSRRPWRARGNKKKHLTITDSVATATNKIQKLPIYINRNLLCKSVKIHWDNFLKTLKRNYIFFSWTNLFFLQRFFLVGRTRGRTISDRGAHVGRRITSPLRHSKWRKSVSDESVIL